MKVAILGYGIEGQSSYRYFSSQGHQLSIHDQNTDIELPDGVDSVLGEQYLDNLNAYDLVVRSPGVRPSQILSKNPAIGPKITTQLNEFLKQSPTKHLYGVTGTKGKGTTSTLIAKMLAACGFPVHLAGNIGQPMLDLLPQLGPQSFVVLELSSFQLIDLNQPAPSVAVCLMVVPEHLNWHSDFNEYISAKSQLFSHQTASDIAIYFAENGASQQIAEASPGFRLPYYTPPGAYVSNDAVMIDGQEIAKTSEIKLLGKHNWQNVCAAVTAVWQISNDVAAIRSVVTSFSGLEHRLEFVAQLNGIKYYNDSFATTPEAATAAIEAFDQPEVLILGGQPKDVSFDSLATSIKSNQAKLAKVMVIGEATEPIVKALDAVGFNSYKVSAANTMQDIVNEATDLARQAKAETKQEPVVLLSPACTSFDMFKSYKDRGEQFKQVVQALAAVGE